MATDFPSVDDAPGRAPVGEHVPRRSQTAHWLVAIGAIVWRDIAFSVRRCRGLIANVLISTVLLVAVTGGFDGFRRALTEPYGTYVAFSNYLLPGLIGLISLLAGSRAAGSLVAGRGAGSLQFFLVAPLPRWIGLFAKLLAVALLVVAQAVIFLLAASLIDVDVDFVPWLAAAPAVMLGVFMITAVSFALLVFLRAANRRSTATLYGAILVFFLSTALYPIWRFSDAEADYLAVIVAANPFTHVVELIRFASEGQLAVASLVVVVGVSALAFALAVIGIDPKRNPHHLLRTGWQPAEVD